MPEEEYTMRPLTDPRSLEAIGGEHLPVVEDSEFVAQCFVCHRLFPMQEVNLIWLHLSEESFPDLNMEVIGNDRCGEFPACAEHSPPEYLTAQPGEDVPVYEAPQKHLQTYLQELREMLEKGEMYEVSDGGESRLIDDPKGEQN